MRGHRAARQPQRAGRTTQRHRRRPAPRPYLPFHDSGHAKRDHVASPAPAPERSTRHAAVAVLAFAHCHPRRGWSYPHIHSFTTPRRPYPSSPSSQCPSSPRSPTSSLFPNPITCSIQMGSNSSSRPVVKKRMFTVVPATLPSTNIYRLSAGATCDDTILRRACSRRVPRAPTHTTKSRQQTPRSLHVRSYDVCFVGCSRKTCA